ncbi:MAG: endonuclease VII domain-containing protein [Dehalococcoidia bacterium]|nr:endonuclease VII domain-containing protein [Dehalococcoidia bacterium]
MARQRVYNLSRRYGLTPSEREALGDVCQICGDDNDPVVDHDHASGRVRGILCRGCNAAIGRLGDTPEALARALQYLTAQQAMSTVPTKETHVRNVP